MLGTRRQLLALTVALLAGGAGMTDALGRAPETLVVACVAEGGKVTVPPALCALFTERLAVAFPARDVTQGAPADLVLVVMRNNAGSFAARIDRGDAKGAPLATARRGAALDDAARAQLLDALIAASAF